MSDWPSPPEIPPRPPRVNQIVDVACDLLESQGWASVSARNIAEQLGIKAPSLYKHVSGMDEVATYLAIDGLILVGTKLEGVTDPLDLMKRYRAIALEDPELYRLMTSREFPREKLPSGLEDWAGYAFFATANRNPVRAQSLWAFAHGMAILEIDNRFAPSGTPATGVWETGARLI